MDTDKIMLDTGLLDADKQDMYTSAENDEIDTLTNPVDLNDVVITKKIKSFELLSLNWDGYNAGIIDEKVIYNSLAFWDQLPDYLRETIESDQVTPTPYGTIVLEWYKNDYFISVEIGKNQIGFFSELPNNENIQLDKISFNPNLIPNELVTAYKVLYT